MLRPEPGVVLSLVLAGLIASVPVAAVECEGLTVDDRLQSARARLQLNSGDRAALHCLGVAWVERENWNEAIAAFRRLAELCPSSPAAANNLAVALAADTRYAEALTELRRLPPTATTAGNRMAIDAVLAFWDPELGSAGTDVVDLTLDDSLDDCLPPPSAASSAAAAVLEPGVAAATEVPPPALEDPTPEADADSLPSPTEVVQAWAEAWRSQKADAYLAAYSSRFWPADGRDLEAWREERRKRLRAPSFIELEIAGLRNRVVDPKRVEIHFRQSYRSDSYQDVVDKTLQMELEEKGWKIIAETVAGGDG